MKLSIKFLKVVAFVFFSCCFLSAYASSKYLPQQYFLSGTFFTGPVTGFIQIPKAGMPGSTTPHRPTLNELGINNNSDFDIEAGANWQRIGVYAGAQILRMKKTATLGSALITHNILIPAGSTVNTKLRLDWYRFGGYYKFFFYHNRFIVKPKAEMDLWNFSYRITNFNVLRKFWQFAFRLGVDTDYYFTKRLYFSANAAVSVPVTYLQIITVDGKLNYQLKSWKKVMPVLFAGINYTHIDFEDRQNMPNHINYTSWPRVLLGFKLNF